MLWSLPCCGSARLILLCPPPAVVMSMCPPLRSDGFIHAQVPLATVPSKGQSRMVTRAQSIRLVAAPGLAESLLGSIAEKVGGHARGGGGGMHAFPAGLHCREGGRRACLHRSKNPSSPKQSPPPLVSTSPRPAHTPPHSLFLVMTQFPAPPPPPPCPPPRLHQSEASVFGPLELMYLPLHPGPDPIFLPPPLRPLFPPSVGGECLRPPGARSHQGGLHHGPQVLVHHPRTRQGGRGLQVDQRTRGGRRSEDAGGWTPLMLCLFCPSCPFLVPQS